jgi:hypothetical protein
VPPDRSGKGRPGEASGGSREVYLEVHPASGGFVKVCAIDAETGLEVSIVGSSKAPQAELERVAINKLRYVMERDAKSKKDKPSKDKPSSGGDDGGGILI